ncbi:hypothetical protein ACFLWV_04025 [Chloroflexota bacterium]
MEKLPPANGDGIPIIAGQGTWHCVSIGAGQEVRKLIRPLKDRLMI